MAAFTGGEKLQAKLRELAQSLRGTATLTVGFPADATYPDDKGTSVPLVASIMEFGGTIPARHVPEHVQTVYHQKMKDGGFAGTRTIEHADGTFTQIAAPTFAKKANANLARDVVVPAHDIPAYSVPARPYFRQMIKNGQQHWADDLAGILKGADYRVEFSMQVLATQMKGELMDSIQANAYAPLAASTIAGKGNAQQLVDTHQMLNSVVESVTTD